MEDIYNFSPDLNDFKLPIRIKYDSDYYIELDKIFTKYSAHLHSIAKDQTKPTYSQSVDIATLNRIRCNICDTLKCFNEENSGNRKKAKARIIGTLKSILDHQFLVSDIENSYAFRGLAPMAIKEVSSSNINYEKVVLTLG
jgi:hypothetical protein